LNSKKKAGLAVAIVVILTSSIAFAAFNQSKPDPAHDYAVQKGLSVSVDALSLTWNSDNGTNEKALIDYVSGFNGSMQQLVVDGFGNMSFEKEHQIEFLRTLPLAEQERSIINGSFTNTDIDGDHQSNRLEQIAGQPWDVKNDRYAVVVNPRNEQTTGSNLASYLINQEKYEPDHVIKLVGNNATKTNFIQAISDISQRSNANDTVLIALDSHSNDKVFCFNNGKGACNSTSTPYCIDYGDMDKAIDSIKAGKMLITIFGCGLDAPIAPLTAGHSQRVVSDIPMYWLYNFSGKYPKEDSFTPQSKVFDLTGNSYISFDEIFKTAAKYQHATTSGVYMSDKDGIASTFYLGDFNINDQT